MKLRWWGINLADGITLIIVVKKIDETGVR